MDRRSSIRIVRKKIKILGVNNKLIASNDEAIMFFFLSFLFIYLEKNVSYRNRSRPRKVSHRNSRILMENPWPRLSMRVSISLCPQRAGYRESKRFREPRIRPRATMILQGVKEQASKARKGEESRKNEEEKTASRRTRVLFIIYSFWLSRASIVATCH